jgi:hypothetical protein
LSSAAGFVAQRAYLFVTDHRFYARTDAAGKFAIEQVPPGDYELVCWLPNWRVKRWEREPEMGVVHRLFFEDGVEQIHRIKVRSGAQANCNLELGLAE